MKKSIFLLAIPAAAIVFFASCDEAELLREVPKSSYSPENSYITPAHYETAVAYLYDRTRAVFYNNETRESFRIISGSDYITDGRNYGSHSIGDYRLVTPTAPHAEYWWERIYLIISSANMIISRLPDAQYTDETARTQMMAEARFFRGFAYRNLANLFGGVPIVTTESNKPKRDYVRASREATWDQAAQDLDFAARYLPEKGTEKAPGRVNRQTAYHFLAEVCISLGRYQDAIDAASAVIDDPRFGLMTTRFGSRSADADGNPYWDLFQMKNQNLSTNREALWVVQMEYDDGRPAEAVGNYKAERVFSGQYYNIRGTDNKPCFIGPTTQNGGRGAGFLRPTAYFDQVWLDDWDDLRNQEPNMIREYIADNPESNLFGKKMSEHYAPLVASDVMPNSYLYPVMSKVSQRGDHPEYIFQDKGLGILTANGSKTYHDLYMARVAETYLLRAEAYLGINRKDLAAADINQIRERAQADPVDQSDVDIDYILDERIRELAYEEPRMMTLCRLGMVYDRVARCNDFTEGSTVAPHNNLWPIPFGEIEKNTEALLEQNPGYVN